MNNSKHIVILGAGYAGIHAAKMLAKKYKKNDDIQITLIDKNPFHTLMTELHEVAGGRVHPESVQVELSKIFHRTKVNLVIDYITNVDTEAQTVTTKNDKFSYDYLLIGTGSEPAFFGVPGVKEHGFTLWSFEDALKIRKHIQNTFEKASRERDQRLRREMLTFVVAGSGFTGIEMAGELLEWKTKLAKEYGIDINEVKLYVVEALGTILNMLDRKQADKAERYMIKHGVEVLKNSPIVEVTPSKIVLKDGSEISTQTLIWTCGIQANAQVAQYGLDRARAGRLQTNTHMQVVGKENVYAIGDIAYFEEEPGKGTPQIVEAAEQTAATAAKNIIADIEKSSKVEFKSNYHGFMVSVGGRYGVANLAGIKLSGFFALVMKHLINMYYLFGVNGVHAVYNYLQHEFFTIEDKRSIMRGHLSSKSNRLWLVPLRLYIGVLWLLEGLKKFVGEETWEAASGLNKLKAGMGSDSWLKSGNVKMPFEWLQVNGTSGASAAADAASGASQAAGAANWPTPIIEKMPKFYEFIMKIMIPNAEVAVWFQRMVVFMEICIGLALIAGLFTFLASAASAFLVVNFVLSAMAGWEILWYFFGSIALMGGAGRTFGLDYFVIPWISKMVGNWWYGDKVAVYKQK
ncbi:FAD-dependent oxidoreductase [Clostridium polynesiense]|uniref:FAD-dependent oxidoreductase n=1 Tax=Clostridium polynesiense TaxID=1325933 RepID=UPI00058F4392|nr:FAD-dependent oxidoreductase [Clostridium polynesiense]